MAEEYRRRHGDWATMGSGQCDGGCFAAGAAL